MANGSVFNFDYSKNIPDVNRDLVKDALARYNPSSTSDRYLSTAIIELLATDFVDTDAYAYGIIDSEGEVLRSRSSLSTSEEKRAFTRLHVLVFNLKKILARGFSKSRVGQIATTAFLLREETGSNLVYQSVLKHLGVTGNLLSESTGKSYTLIANRVLHEATQLPLTVLTPSPVAVVAGIPVFLGESEDGDTFAFTPNEILVEDGEGGGAIANTSANVDGGASSGKGPLIKRDKFANIDVFSVSSEDYNKSRFGRKRYNRWSNHISSPDHAKAIKKFAWKNPEKHVIVKNEGTGEMAFLHYGRKK